MKIFKKIVLIFMVVVVSGGVLYAAAPSFDRNFANYLTDDTPDRYGRVETVFDIGIDRDLSLMDNVKRLFYPSSASFTLSN
jgi:fructose-specific phosphotransferase system IIC component